MKHTKPVPHSQPMEVINKPNVAHTKKSLQFLIQDRRKIVSAIIVILLPLVSNAWRFVSEDIEFPIYGTLYMFVWTFAVNFLVVMLSAAWYFSIPAKDYAMHIIVLSSLAFGIFSTCQTLPFSDDVPLWQDLVISAVIFAFLYTSLRYIQKNYLEKPNDYKVLHDGLVYDLHHQRFMGSINRIAGLLEVAEMDEPYKHLCCEEIKELKESIAYIAEKYEALK